ncbi:MAG: hypothetical protein L6367_13470 [Cellulomonas sp.]|nr:hypothetical protein [Cellulomonas sp.]
MTLDRRRIVALDLNADADTAWAHVRRPELIRRWYAWDTDDLDERIRRVFVSAPRAVSDGRRRELHWPDSTVLRLAPTGDPARTSLTIDRPSHEGLSFYDGVRDALDESWVADAHQLQFALAAHPGEERHTWAVRGLDAGPHHDRLLDRIGLHGVRGVPIGGHVSTRRPDGTLIGGTLVYRTPLQFGVHLHGFAESLLVVMEHPAAVRPPHGQVDVTLSTYGLDDALREQVVRRWGSWWRVPVGAR